MKKGRLFMGWPHNCLLSNGLLSLNGAHLGLARCLYPFQKTKDRPNLSDGLSKVCTYSNLFCDHFKFNISCFSISEINVGFVAAQFLDFIWQRDFFAIYLVSLLIANSSAYLEIGYASEDLSA